MSRNLLNLLVGVLGVCLGLGQLRSLAGDPLDKEIQRVLAAGGGTVAVPGGTYDPIRIDLRGRGELTLVLDAGVGTIKPRDSAAPLLVVIGESNPRRGLTRFLLRGGRWLGRLEGVDVSFSGWAPLSVEGASPGLRLDVRDSQCENVVIGGASHVVRFVDCKPAIHLDVVGPGGTGQRSFARLRVRDIYVHGGAALVSHGNPYGGVVEGVGGNISNADTDALFYLYGPSPYLAIRDVDVEGDGLPEPFAIVRRNLGDAGPPTLSNCSWRQRVGELRVRLATPIAPLPTPPAPPAGSIPVP